MKITKSNRGYFINIIEGKVETAEEHDENLTVDIIEKVQALIDDIAITDDVSWTKLQDGLQKIKSGEQSEEYRVVSGKIEI